MNTDQLYPHWTPAGGHFNKACADEPFLKTSLYVKGLVIASSYYFIVFKVDALSRECGWSNTNIWQTIMVRSKESRRNFRSEEATSYVGAQTGPFLHWHNIIVGGRRPCQWCLDNPTIHWPVTSFTSSVGDVWGLRGCIDLAFVHVEWWPFILEGEQ